jgi:hypothetical protein
MKKIILTLTIVAFAVAVQAAEGQGCCKSKAACTDKDKAACAEKAKVGCPAKAGCPFKAEAAKKVVMSPKAAGEAAK